MTQSNDSFQKTADGSGPLIATHAPGDGKEYQVVALSDEGGHLKRTRETYRLFVPSSAVGANKVFFDLFNATGSGLTLRVLGVFAVPNLDTISSASRHSTASASVPVSARCCALDWQP